MDNKKGTQKDVNKIIKIFRQTGSIDFLQNKLKEFSEKAKKCLIVLRNSESKEVLNALADYSVTRSY